MLDSKHQIGILSTHSYGVIGFDIGGKVNTCGSQIQFFSDIFPMRINGLY